MRFVFNDYIIDEMKLYVFIIYFICGTKNA
jgi:hypothetical protein